MAFSTSMWHQRTLNSIGAFHVPQVVRDVTGMRAGESFWFRVINNKIILLVPQAVLSQHETAVQRITTGAELDQLVGDIFSKSSSDIFNAQMREALLRVAHRADLYWPEQGLYEDFTKYWSMEILAGGLLKPCPSLYEALTRSFSDRRIIFSSCLVVEDDHVTPVLAIDFKGQRALSESLFSQESRIEDEVAKKTRELCFKEQQLIEREAAFTTLQDYHKSTLQLLQAKEKQLKAENKRLVDENKRISETNKQWAEHVTKVERAWKRYLERSKNPDMMEVAAQRHFQYFSDVVCGLLIGGSSPSYANLCFASSYLKQFPKALEALTAICQLLQEKGFVRSQENMMDLPTVFRHVVMSLAAQELPEEELPDAPLTTLFDPVTAPAPEPPYRFSPAYAALLEQQKKAPPAATPSAYVPIIPDPAELAPGMKYADQNNPIIQGIVRTTGKVPQVEDLDSDDA